MAFRGTLDFSGDALASCYRIPLLSFQSLYDISYLIRSREAPRGCGWSCDRSLNRGIYWELRIPGLRGANREGVNLSAVAPVPLPTTPQQGCDNVGITKIIHILTIDHRNFIFCYSFGTKRCLALNLIATSIKYLPNVYCSPLLLCHKTPQHGDHHTESDYR